MFTFLHKRNICLFSALRFFCSFYAAVESQNVICIVELVKEILHHDWSKAVHLKPITARLYMIIQR